MPKLFLYTDFLIMWPNKKPKRIFSLLAYKRMPISLKMFDVLIHSTYLCCFNGHVGHADYKK